MGRQVPNGLSDLLRSGSEAHLLENFKLLLYQVSNVNCVIRSTELVIFCTMPGISSLLADFDCSAIPCTPAGPNSGGTSILGGGGGVAISSHASCYYCTCRGCCGISSRRQCDCRMRYAAAQKEPSAGS